MVHLIGGASALNGDHNKAPACLFIRCCTYHIIIAKAFPHPILSQVSQGVSSPSPALCVKSVHFTIQLVR